jgi:hypothetical protein
VLVTAAAATADSAAACAALSDERDSFHVSTTYTAVTNTSTAFVTNNAV